MHPCADPGSFAQVGHTLVCIQKAVKTLRSTAPVSSLPSGLAPAGRHLPSCRLRRYLASLTLPLLLSASVSYGAAHPPVPRLTFEELTRLSQEAQPDARLQARLDALLTTPVVRNKPSPSSAPDDPTHLRVTEWNIERGQNLDAIEQVLASPQALPGDAQGAGSGSVKAANKEARRKAVAQAALLRQSDVILLNEVDIGVKRTDYRNVVDALADLLGMSSAYAVEFVEVDGLSDLGTEPAVLATPALSARMTEDLRPDHARYQGLHVNAILSRYPLQNARVVALPVCYDWFNQEGKKISQLEKAKRKAANLLFLERIERELRRGGRNALVADIVAPPAPGGAGTPVRLVDAHLENRCRADCRNRQMKALLGKVSDTAGPLVLAGDLNTTGTDATPTSIRYELSSRLRDYQFWVSNLLHFTPVSLPVYATAPFTFWKNFRDPTAIHIPLVGKNPEARMFADLRRFRFADGSSFDFGGAPGRNRQKSSKTLSDSNERAGKGFVPTFSMQRDFGGLIKYRLDWILVKPARDSIRARAQAAFLPQMPVTLQALNQVLPERLSDHAPISVELSLGDMGR